MKTITLEQAQAILDELELYELARKRDPKLPVGDVGLCGCSGPPPPAECRCRRRVRLVREFREAVRHAGACRDVVEEEP